MTTGTPSTEPTSTEPAAVDSPAVEVQRADLPPTPNTPEWYASLGVATVYLDGTGVERVPPAATLQAAASAILAAQAAPSSRVGIDSSATEPAQCVSGPQPPNTWGMFVPLAALRRDDRRDHGSGDLTGLSELAEVVADLGGSVIGTLPLVARRPDQASPYSPLTRRFWDERWVDPVWVAARVGVRRPRRRPAVRGSLADPAAAWESTRAALATVLQRCGALPDETNEWRVAHPEVERWARWKAAALVVGWDPRDWPESLSTAVRDGDMGDLARYGVTTDAIEFEVFAQWAVSAQLGDLGQRLRDRSMALYLDLPVGTDASGYDVWDHPEDYAIGMTIGAPPDRFFPEGQGWGLVPPLPGRGDLRRCLEAHLGVCGLLRIDHVMGLHRLFWVPEGLSAEHGTYVTYPAAAQWELVAELSAATECGVVGEDLGTVPDEARQAMAAHGARGLFIGQDEIRPPFRLGRPVPRWSVASLNTHDLEPVAAWHAARQPASSASEVRDHLLGELAASEADLVLVAEQDLTLDPRRLNVPGEVGGDVWLLRSTTTVEELRDGVGVGEHARRVLANVDAWRRTERGTWPVGSAPSLDGGDIASLHHGTHARLAERFGLHPRAAAGVLGCEATVWAPRATEVTVAGEFDGWSGSHLQQVGSSGVWSGFVPAAVLGDRYKIHVRAQNGQWLHKSDPFARAAELPPGNASIVTADDPAEQWSDGEWMAGRAGRHRPDQAMSIYELHLGSWRRHEDGRVPTYTELAPWLVEYVQKMGFTHVELMPVMEHPFGGSWGYHVTGYFAPTVRYGTPAEFAALVDELHRNDIGVILDWVPAHFPDDAHGLADFDGQPLFEYSDPREGRHPEWGSRVFDFGRPEVRAFLVSSAHWWIEKFHVDGLRVDAVASMLYRNYGRSDGEWVANVHGGRENLEAGEFVRHLTTELHLSHPGVLVIAEESTSWPGVTAPIDAGGLGFDLKWDLGWMHDMLDYLGRDPVHRGWHQDDLTFRAMYAHSERFVLPLSHDEVVHGKGSLVAKMAGDDWQRRANLRLLFGQQHTVPGVPLVFMGGELAMNEEWDHERPLPWYLLDHGPHAGMQAWVAELNRLRRSHPALADVTNRPGSFEWIDCEDRTNSVVSWVRRAADGSQLLVVLNCTPQPHDHYRIGAPSDEDWCVIADSDDQQWGGSGYRTADRFPSEMVSVKGWDRSIVLTLPPLAVVILAPESPSSASDRPPTSS